MVSEPRAPARRRQPPPPPDGPPHPATDTDGRLRGETLVRAVLEATLDELASVGFTALSVERVAERAGVNKTTVYRRWPTKADLVAAAMHDPRQGAVLVPNTGNLHQDLVTMLLAAARFLGAPRGKGIFRMLLTEHHSPEMAHMADRMRREGENAPRLLLQRAIARGELSPDVDLGLLLQALFGPLIHRVFLENDILRPEEAEQLVRLVLHGAAPPSVPPGETRRARRPARRS